jgi:integrase
MADIRKRTGPRGTTYQVRYPSKAAEKGYAYKVFSTLKDARAFREDASARPTAGPLSKEIRKVEQGVRKWLDVCEKEGVNGRPPVTAGTLENYKYRADIILAYDWEKPLHELTRADAVEFRSWLLANHSRSVARKVFVNFHSMVREMITREVLIHDFVAGVAIQDSSPGDELVKIPAEAEILKLLSAADRLANSKNPKMARAWRRYRPMLYLAADSGMRPQEYIVVPRSNVIDHGVQVDRALERLGGISVTKTPAGRRFVELSPHTYDMVRHYAKNHAIPNQHDLIFPTENGQWIEHKNWLRRGFYVACIEAGLVEEAEEAGETVVRPRYRPYDLRHFYASMLIERRVNLKRIQYLMGHEDIKTTLNTYGHLIERAEAKTDRTPGLLASMGGACGEFVAAAE